jgi:O-acetylserine/cysteine efflux transporter
VATRIGLDELSPPQLAAARFLVAAAPVLVVARPRAPWAALVAVGLTLFAGLAAIALTVGGDLSVAGLALTLVSPVSFAVGNLLWKRLPPAAPLELVAWLSLVPPIPATTVVTPFALLVPFVAAASSALVFGERFGALRLVGMALVLIGLAAIVLPPVRPAAA